MVIAQKLEYFNFSVSRSAHTKLSVIEFRVYIPLFFALSYTFVNRTIFARIEIGIGASLNCQKACEKNT